MDGELKEELEELSEEERIEREGKLSLKRGEAMEDKATVLLVAPGSADRDRIGGWLEDAGYEVLMCPGPGEECDCVGLQGKRCSLAFGADIVVLDMGPGDDPSGPVLPGWRLLDLYSRWQLPLVAVVPWGVLVTEDPVIPVERPAAREELLGAVTRSLSGRFVRHM